MAVCTTQDLGRIKKIGMFLADAQMRPLFGPDMGYLDDCPASFESSDNVDDGEEFTRRCADGSIKRFVPGVKSLQSIDVNVDLHWLDPEWLASTGGAAAILHESETIGWADRTSDRFNVIIIVWQELLGNSDGADFVRIYPIKGATVSEEGTPGSEDNYFRVMGSTTDSHFLGKGPLPLAQEPVSGIAEWISEALPTDGHRFRFIGAAAPAGCGSMVTVAPV